MIRTRLSLLAVAAAAAVVLVLALANARDERQSATAEARAADTMASTFLEEVHAFDSYLLLGDERARDEIRVAAARFDAAARQGRAGVSEGEVEELAELRRQVATVREWRAEARASRPGLPVAERERIHTRTDEVVDRFLTLSRAFRYERHAESKARVAAAERLTIGLVVAVTILAAGLGYITVERRARRDAARAEAERERRAAQAQFVEALQAARTETEADRLLQRQLERTVSGARALVMRRNHSGDRLEPVTEVSAESPLAAPLAQADPAACIAVRLARPHGREPGEEPLLACDICGRSPGPSLCLPSVVGGEVIGAVLLEHERALADGERERLEESVAQASPILANLRNLRIAERQAATDGLTGLANKRTADDTLRRMLAQASRLVTPLAVVIFDLDHFKDINDTYGHAKGDEVLAAAAGAAVASLRTSDFVARYGGEEFLALLPGTAVGDAAVVADKVRAAITRVRVPGLSTGISASFGVASYPEAGTEPDTLLRQADRALYAAKERGRNRVEIAASAQG